MEWNMLAYFSDQLYVIYIIIWCGDACMYGYYICIYMCIYMYICICII